MHAALVVTGGTPQFTATVRGRFDVTENREEVRSGAGDCMLYPVGKPFSSVWHGFDVRALRLPLDAVAQVATTRAGLPAGDFRFESTAPVHRGPPAPATRHSAAPPATPCGSEP